MRVNFYLKDRSKVETVVRMFIRYDKELLIYPTGLGITRSTKLDDPKNPWKNDWNNSLQRARKKNKNDHKTAEFNSRLDEIEATVKQLFRKYQNDNQHKVPSPVVLRELLDRAFSKDTSHIKDSVLLSWKLYKDKSEKIAYQYSGYFEEFYQNTKVRHNEKTGRPFSKNTVRNYKTTRDTLRAFIESRKRNSRKVEFMEVNLEFYYDFLKFLSEKNGLSPNSVGTHIKNLKSVIRDGEERGHDVNPAYKSRKFITVQEVTDTIYLTESEIRELVELDLSGDARLDRVRDQFIIECRTGLRYSDTMKLKDDDFKEGRIRVRTQKMNELVYIPVHPDVSRIRSKYTNEEKLPEPISNQKFNQYIKEVCSKVKSLNRTVNVTEGNGKSKVSKRVPKFTLVSSHTARRSFATNLYLEKLPVRTIMRILGHTKETTFYKYIRMTPEDDVKILESHWNNTASTLKVV